MTEILIRVRVDDEYADPDDRTGVTEDGFNVIHETVGETIGDVVDVTKATS
jgi:hypothetical protein